MPIQPASVSVTDPVSRAVERTKQLLFQPFNLQRWFIIGFCAWLATLGENGGFRFNYRTGSFRNAGSFREFFEQARAYVMDNLIWIVPLAIVLVVLGVAFGVAILWVSSRGKFMFLHCVALDKAQIKEPWDQFAREGNSLFGFRLVVGLIALVTTFPLVALIFIRVWRIIEGGAPTIHGIVVIVVLGFAFAAFCVAGAVVMKLTTDFVVPIMFLRRNRCAEAWREFLRLFPVNTGNFIVYLLFQIVLGVATTAVVIFVVLITCCIAGCLMAIPYLGSVLLLPILTFKRSYSIHYLAQYGPDYDVFPPSPSFR